MGGGGGGVLSASGPIQKAWGGGGGGAWVCAVHLIQAQYERREGCVAEEGEVPYNLLNIPLIINDFRNFNNSSAKIFSYIYRA